MKDLAAEVLGAKIQQNEHCPVCVILYAWIMICDEANTSIFTSLAHDCLHGDFLYSYRLRMPELRCSFTTSTRKHGRKT